MFNRSTVNILLVGLTAPPRNVLALKKYAVYYDTFVEPNRNPMGEGWEPVSPGRWGDVDKESYEDVNHFFRYERRTSASIDYDGNECENRYYYSTAKNGAVGEARINVMSSDRHKQSPTILQKDEKCKDNHGMNYDLGNCKTSDLIEVAITPYSLRSSFQRCKFRVDMDVSGCGNPWAFMALEVKSPSEHVIRKGDRFQRYDGEIQLLHRGGNDDNHDKVLIISILLESGGHHAPDPELEKYVQQWENRQTEQYERCNIRFDDKSCSLKKDKHLQFVGNIYKKESSNAMTLTLDEDPTLLPMVEEPDDAEEGMDFNNSTRRNLRRNHNRERKHRALRALLSSSEEEKLAKTADFTPYNLWLNTGTKYFYKMEGSLTHPPCMEDVEWRIMRKPLKISKNQMRRIDDLLARHLDEERCVLATVGDYRKDGTCHVNVNRPIQYASEKHDMKDCDEWYSD